MKPRTPDIRGLSLNVSLLDREEVQYRLETTLLIVFDNIMCVTRISANLVTYQRGSLPGCELSQSVVTRHQGSPCSVMSNPAQSYQRANRQPVPLAPGAGWGGPTVDIGRLQSQRSRPA